MDEFISSAESRILTESDLATGSSASSSSSAFLRRIEFQRARKSFHGFATGSSDFKIETLNPSSDASRPGSCASLSGMGGKKSGGSDLLENGLDPEFSFGLTVRKIGAGLENLGNTCFLNSVLQCLTYTEPLAAYLQSGKHQNSCHIAGFCALCAIQKHVSRALQATGRILAPKDLVSNLRCISRNFRNSRQEDAHEYMINLLESMHKCCLPSGVPSESPSAYDRSLVHRIFGGRLRSQVKCMQCSHCSNKFDPFLDLSLDIMKVDSLQKALSHFTVAELLDEGSKVYQCERCKQKVRAVKQLTVHKAPYVLTIHLKRFRAHDSGKIDKKVQFGSTIDMKPFVSGSYEGDLKYTLYGVLVHYGWSIHSGHYACFVRTSSGMWYSLDDNRVVQVSERTVMDQKAYMLFYVRDRRSLVPPKKPIQVIQKENPNPNVTINNSSSLTKLKEQANGSTKGKLFSVDSSASTAQKNPNSHSPSSGAFVKDASSLQANTQTIARAAEPIEDSAAKSTTLGVPSLGGQSEASGSVLSRNANVPKSENTVKASANHGNSIDDGNHRNKQQVPVSISSNGDSPQDLNVEKLATDETLHKNILNSGSSNVTLPGNPVVNTLKKVPSLAPAAGFSDRTQLVASANKHSYEKSQAGSSSSSNLPNKGVRKNDQSTALKSNELVEMRTPKKKLKKVWMSRAINMQVGLKFFKLSLGLRKKKKHKRSKRSALEIKDLAEEEPSTSEACRTVSSGSARKKKERKLDGDSLTDTSVGDLKERIHQNGSVLATENNHAGCSKEDREGNSQKEMMNILTRGLQATVVGTWDDQESPQLIESKRENISIGYVPDEWDEEYDRGKRKKIRSNQHDFSGPNLFQLVASKKSQQQKRPKLGRPAVSADTSFRI